MNQFFVSMLCIKDDASILTLLDELIQEANNAKAHIENIYAACLKEESLNLN
ncbi:MAG: hypothetical protein KGQ65_04325 [Burkholderiales bacterium]|jgi:hypothetical protein|nr:hypothetical protein [Burkholderiales bacterium]